VHEPVDLFAVLLDELADALGATARVGTDVGDGTAQPDIVSHVVHSIRVFEELVDIGLTNAEAAVEVPSLVRFAAI
jgi:hypothetical protein